VVAQDGVPGKQFGVTLVPSEHWHQYEATAVKFPLLAPTKSVASFVAAVCIPVTFDHVVEFCWPY
jgi:hypothetical protein